MLLEVFYTTNSKARNNGVAVNKFWFAAAPVNQYFVLLSAIEPTGEFIPLKFSIRNSIWLSCMTL